MITRWIELSSGDILIKKPDASEDFVPVILILDCFKVENYWHVIGVGREPDDHFHFYDWNPKSEELFCHNFVVLSRKNENEKQEACPFA